MPMPPTASADDTPISVQLGAGVAFGLVSGLASRLTRRLRGSASLARALTVKLGARYASRRFAPPIACGTPT